MRGWQLNLGLTKKVAAETVLIHFRSTLANNNIVKVKYVVITAGLYAADRTLNVGIRSLTSGGIDYDKIIIDKAVNNETVVIDERREGEMYMPSNSYFVISIANMAIDETVAIEVKAEISVYNRPTVSYFPSNSSVIITTNAIYGVYE